jgi:hypothetical protein
MRARLLCREDGVDGVAGGRLGGIATGIQPSVGAVLALACLRQKDEKDLESDENENDLLVCEFPSDETPLISLVVRFSNP